MDWENERYVRRYVRETPDDAVLSWEARALWDALMLKFDRAGVIDMGRHGWRGVAVLVRIPIEVVERSVDELLIDGRIEVNGQSLVAPNFIAAQEAKQSDRQRTFESRARRREIALRKEVLSDSDSKGVAKRDIEDTKRDIEDTKRVSSVTVGHDSSQSVTLSCAKPSCAVSLEHPKAARQRSEVSADAIELAYQSYPRKKGKAPGIKKAKKLIRTTADLEKFQECIEWMEKAWAGADTTYCPYFSTFVANETWRDDEWPAPERKPSAGGLVSKLNLVEL